jgi:class 3 adenylate cyclase
VAGGHDHAAGDGHHEDRPRRFDREVRALVEPDLTALLADHHHLVSRIAGQHDGRIVKPEGDGLWLVFPSVTAASLAAMAILEEFRIAQPGKGDDRLTMRVVIYCLTFASAGVALEAAERLRQEWAHLQQHDGHRCPMNVAVLKGTLNLFRSYMFGNDVNDVMMIESRSHPLTEGGGIFVTGRVRDQLVDTRWTARLQRVELPNRPPRLEGIAVYQLV